MKRLKTVLVLWMVVAIAGSGVSAEEGEVPKTISSSRQFVIYGKELRVRAAMAVYMDGLREEFLKLTGLEEGDSDTEQGEIVIRVHELDPSVSVAPKPRVSIKRWEFGGFHYQLDVFLGPEFRRDLMEEELIRLLFAEQILRGKESIDLPPGGRLLPDWLHVGVVEALRHRRGGRQREGFTTIWSSGKAMTPRDLFLADMGELGVLEIDVYRASAAALILALHSQPESKRGMRSMVRSLSRGGVSSRDLLQRHFPGLQGSQQSLEKWWALKMAALAEPTVFDLWTVDQTEQFIESSLTLFFPEEDSASDKDTKKKFLGLIPYGGGKKDESSLNVNPKRSEDEEAAEMRQVPLEEFREIVGRGDVDQLVKKNLRQMMLIKTRCYPPHQPVVASYMRLFDGLSEADGREEEIDQMIIELAEVRRTILESAREVEYHLDWYEATGTTERSEEFDRYLRIMRELDHARPVREDAVSQYLDAIQKEWE